MPYSFEINPSPSGRGGSITCKGTRTGLEGLRQQVQNALDNGSAYSGEPLGTPDDGDLTIVLMPDHWKPRGVK